MSPNLAKLEIALSNSMQTEEDQVLTIEELASYLKVSKSTLYKLVQNGAVPGHKVGRHWRFRRETIDRWLDSSSGSIPTPNSEPLG